MAEVAVVLKAVEPVRSFVFGAIREYVGYIRRYEDNLGALRKSLSEVCNKKDDVRKKVKVGNDKQEEITREAASWLKDIRILTNDEELKGLMYSDTKTAKFVVKMMEKRDLKSCISKDSEMQKLAIKVMKKFEEEMDECEEEMRKMAEEDYKQVAEVVVEVMKDTIEDFKKLMKEDQKMAVIATRTLKDRDIDKLTKGDQEMEEIIREAGNISDEEFCRNQKNEESDALLVKIPTVVVGENSIKQAAKKLFTPLGNLVIPLGKLMDDANFKKAVPEADGVKLGLEVIDGLLIGGHGLKKEVDDNTKQHRGCCCSSLSLCSGFHGRYLISKAAEIMSKHIQDEIINKCPQDPVTLHIRTVDLKPIPTQFLKGLDSRTQLLDQILEKLMDDQVDSVGVFGMGGTGKTTLAKEVIKRVKDAFAIKVMVEVSDAPDFVRIQAAIAESIDLPLHDVDNVSQRAIRLYNRLILEKEKKILVILDNVWKKLNLDEIGIPDTCKLLLTTRDREVCRVMDVRDVNILEVGLMKTNEARELFMSQAGKLQADVGEHKNLVQRLLSKCGGLPLAIVTTANSLKGKNLSTWVKFAEDLEKPISSQMTYDYHHTFTILNTSYKFIQPNGKRIFFLLVSLFPLGSSASIESLLRYGIGLNLFGHVNKLSEAMDKAAKWADELTLSSMLLEGDGKGDVKIHDIVRDFAISYAAKVDEHEFMVESIPRWLEDEDLKIYTAMSLTSKDDCSRLSGVEVCKLQILILKGDLSLDFADDFFSGMVNLKVLALSNMDFKPALPESMRKLNKLRTLCMEDCKLGNFELVGELVNLLVLSLRGSYMENVPNEIGNLRKLRLLDLAGCISSKLPLIPICVLNKLSTLEGLYMYNKRSLVYETKYEDGEACAIENIRLPYLCALDIRVQNTEKVPNFKSLEKFKISVGCYNFSTKFCRSLNLRGIDVNGVLTLSCLNILFKKADSLEMRSGNFEDLVPQLDQEGFRSLKNLSLYECEDIKCIVDGRSMNNMMVFPCLQSLQLERLLCLEKICNDDVSPGSFFNLQTIQLSYLLLQYGLPLVPRNLKEIQVSCCEKLEFIFIEDEDVPATELPFLKTLKLEEIDSLISLVGPKEFPNSYEALQEPRPFFGGKIGLPSLEEFKLKSCHNVGKLWSNEIHTPGFQNLKNIKIHNCVKLSNVGSAPVFSNLVQLEKLIITKCSEMHEVISHEEVEESKIGEQCIVFPQLVHLRLEDLGNLESFYGGRSKLLFPKLKTLILYDLRSMKMFAKLENCSALFHEKIDLPCLEELKVINVGTKVTGIWDMQSLTTTTTSNPTPMLRQLELGSSTGLRQIPGIVLEKLSSIKLTYFGFQDGDVVFSSSKLREKCRFVYSQLPKLEVLKIEGSRSLEELFEKEDNNGVNDALTSFCRQVKEIVLCGLPSLNMIPLHLFKSIAFLTLMDLKWNNLTSAADILTSLHQLQSLTIEYCHHMEALVINVGSQIEFPSLKHLHLSNLDSFISFSSMPKDEAALILPSLETLVINMCDKLEYFWQGSIFAPRLQDVSIKNCDDLQHLLVGNIEDTIELPSLRKLSFWWCKKIKSISKGSVTAPNLREVKLDQCRDMDCLFLGNQNQDGDQQLPSLEVVDISDCSNLHEFSLRCVVAPKLTQIYYDDEEYSMLPYDDLNHFLKETNPKKDDNEGDKDDDDDDGSYDYEDYEDDNNNEDEIIVDDKDDDDDINDDEDNINKD